MVHDVSFNAVFEYSSSFFVD